MRYTHGGYSLVAEPRFVEPIARVRFSLAAQNAYPDTKVSG